MMRQLFILTVFLAGLTPAAAQDWQIIRLQAESKHQGSKVWSGYFRGLNGRDYNAAQFYRPQREEFSAFGIVALDPHKKVSWLVPLAVDAGYDAKLFQAEPLAAIGFGAAVRTGPYSVVSLRADNLLVAGGRVSEQPCYDGFRRRYHCGTGTAWTDYQRSDVDRRGRLAVPALYARFVHRFSF